jgi:hypothetical protein
MSTNDPYKLPGKPVENAADKLHWNEAADHPRHYQRTDIPQDYKDWPYPGWPKQPPTNGLAVAALVLGIVWAFWIGSALAIIFGHVALGQIRQRNQSGKGMAVAGLVLGYVGAGTFALFVVLPLLLGAGA